MSVLAKMKKQNFHSTRTNQIIYTEVKIETSVFYSAHN